MSSAENITSHDGAAELLISVDLLLETKAASYTSRQIYFVAQRPPKHLKDESFGRFSKHRSIVDLQQTLEICTPYEDSANFQKMNALQNSRPQQTCER